jgi:hypothetical protein
VETNILMCCVMSRARRDLFIDGGDQTNSKGEVDERVVQILHPLMLNMKDKPFRFSNHA